MQVVRLVAAALLAAILSGCSREITRAITPNQLPEVRLTVEAVSGPDGAIDYAMAWSAEDPDGRVDHYLVGIDRTSVAPDATGWITTRDRRHAVRIARAGTPRLGLTDPEDAAHHVFAVRAVDDGGAISKPATRAFFGENAAPVVTIVDPLPGHPFIPTLPPSFQIRWAGSDPDGRVVSYRYRLFGRDNPDRPDLEDFIDWAIAHPDSFAALYEPDFEGWQSADGAAILATLSDLTQNTRYMFAITAFDEDGAYDPVFSPDKNMLEFEVQLGAGAPTLLFGGTPIPMNGSQLIALEIPGDQIITLNIAVAAAPGAPIKLLRWRMGEKEGEFGTKGGALRIGPFTTNGEVIVLELEAITTVTSYVQLIRFTVVRPEFDKALLIVDDTRLPPDQFINGQLEPPRGGWPSAAELDTFFFAVGGFPWRGYPNNSPASPSWPRLPSGQPLTIPGLFSGYDFDTVGTRGIPGGAMPLSILGRYRHVVWHTDQVGATFSGNPLDPRTPITMLRRMNQPGGTNTLATYVAAGGRLWLMGGGSAYATLIEWNRPGTPTDEYSDADNELVPGRFMVDWARWRTRIRTPVTVNRLALHLPGVLTPFNDPSTAPGRGWPGQPNYSGLPPNLNLRTPATDLLPPRVASSNFFIADFPGEILTEPNVILEDGASVLDTLYFAAYTGLPPSPTMTLHHGADGNPALFSGIGIWNVRRSQAIPVVDFVLQQLWGLPRQNVPRDPARVRIAARGGNSSQLAPERVARAQRRP